MTTRSTATVAALAALGLTPLAAAQTLEFEDLALNSLYPVYDSFVTEGVLVNVEEYQSDSGGTASVQNPNPDAAGSGHEIFAGNTFLDFQFNYPLTTIGFGWADFGGSVGLSVNGVTLYAADMIDFDNSVQGGANVSVVMPVGGIPTDYGYTTITGVITQFAVGGQEFFIDDVRRIPAPGAASILAFGALAGARRRRR